MGRLPFILTIASVFCLYIIEGSFAQSSLDVEPGPTPEATTQLILVSVPVQKETNATITCLERADANSEWEQKLGPIPTKIGRGGLASYGEMQETGAKTPQGEFDLGFLFGVDPEAPEGVKLAYRQITKSDFWIDEAYDPAYNYWVSGEEPAASHERLILGTCQYDLVVPIHYNINPTTPGRGSAIFFHLWKDENTATGGCVAISRENMLDVLRWMDPHKRPRMRIVLAERQ